MADYLYGPIEGVVSSRKDPQNRGRVTVRVAGLFDGKTGAEETSAWAEPLSFGGMGKDRGHVGSPQVGARVVVFAAWDQATRSGDPDRLYYLAGSARRGEVPVEYRDEDVEVVVFRDYAVVVDESEESPRLVVRHRLTGDSFEHNSLTLAITVGATAGVTVRSSSRIDLTAPVITINGRLVLPGGPIT